MPSPSPRATIIDVAELAGVSRQTVTRALNGLADVAPATRDRVVEAARSLSYRPNRAAQSLVQGRRTTIGLVIDDLGNPYFAELASALSREAAEHDWSLLLCDVGTDPAKSRAQLASMIAGVDAVLLTGCRGDTVALLPDEVLAGEGLRMPLVMLDGPEHPRLDARVVLDLAPAMTEALRHLVASGRRRVAFVDSSEGPGDRLDLYRRLVAEAGLPGADQPAFAGPESLEGGADGVRQVLAAWPEADAVVVYNDLMALGALKALADAGRSVPGDVAVVGVDGLALGRAVTPELTTLSIDKARLAREAVALLDAALSDPGRDGGQDPRRLVSVPLTLTLRDSA